MIKRKTIENDEQTFDAGKSHVITLSGERADERARQSAPRVGCLMSAFVLQNDGRGERLGFRVRRSCTSVIQQLAANLARTF